MSPHPLVPRKVPRVDLQKLREGGAAGRRASVAALGDAFRETGAVRLLGGTGDVPPATLRALGLELLGALEEYFGLADGALRSRVDPTPGAASAPIALIEIGRAETLRVLSRDGDRIPCEPRPGEWLALAGPALESLTRGVVPAASVETVDGAPRDPGVVVTAERTVAVPLPAFSDPP